MDLSEDNVSKCDGTQRTLLDMRTTKILSALLILLIAIPFLTSKAFANFIASVNFSTSVTFETLNLLLVGSAAAAVVGYFKNRK